MPNYIQENKLDTNDFTVDGSGNVGTKIKYKKITGTTPASQGNLISVAHGLTSTKIVSIDAVVHQASGEGCSNSYTVSAGFQYDYSYDSTNAFITLTASNSANILSKSFTIIIGYEE